MEYQRYAFIFFTIILNMQFALYAPDPAASYNLQTSEQLCSLFRLATEVHLIPAMAVPRYLLLENFIRVHQPDQHLDPPKTIASLFQDLNATEQRRICLEEIISPALREEATAHVSKKRNLDQKISEIVSDLLTQKASPNGMTRDELVIPLITAIKYRWRRTAQRLLQDPATDPNLDHTFTDSAFETALYYGAIKILPYLLQHPRLDINKKRPDCIGNGQYPPIAICSKAYVNSKNPISDIKKNQQKAFRLLLQYGAVINFPIEHSGGLKQALDPRLYALVESTYGSIPDALRNTQHSDTVDPENTPILVYAAGRRNPAIVKMLLTQPGYRADIDVISQALQTIRCIAGRFCRPEWEYQHYHQIQQDLIFALKQPLELLKETMADNYKQGSFQHIPSDIWAQVGIGLYGPKLHAYLYSSSDNLVNG
jgi:hypothetical protein